MKDKIKEKIKKWYDNRIYQKKIDELKKRDPFIYKNF